ncbi:hypothetical protein C8R47DRAFT_1212997 [Mycena vitilis]|nr:hypothetical protein C8R47DRAFT_1212997 [Mycena vitilis]
MPSSRTCGILGAWAFRLASTFKPAAPELPLSIFDTQTAVEEATEDAHLALSSPFQRELDVSHGSEDWDSVYSSGDWRETSNSSHVADDPFSASPVLRSPLLSWATPPLIQMSPPPGFLPPKIPPSMIEPGYAVNDISPEFLPALSSLGERRGFKGAPLFTPATARKRSASFLSLSSTFSPKSPLSPRTSPSTPRTARPTPSTPRTPLSTVTNLLRTPTANSPKLSAMPMECPVSEALQQCYDLDDPFSAAGASFYLPETVCASVPVLNLTRLDIYRPALPPLRSRRTFFKAVEAASRTTPRIRETNVYDMMVYNFQPKFDKKKFRSSRHSKWARVSLHIGSTTKAPLLFPSEEPRVLLPQHFAPDYKIFSEHEEPGPVPVPVDFYSHWHLVLLWESQNIVVNIRSTIPILPPPRQCPDALVTTDMVATVAVSSIALASLT